MAKLKQDNLGAKGESRFSEWCEDEGLICNKSLRDRAGWDYIVDFEHDETSKDLLDHRKPPLSCVVQVKTVQDSTDRISVKLNMAERLAKEPKPSFFVVFKVDDKKNFTSAHVIHVMDDILSSILKRLRREESHLEREAINKKHVTFKLSEESRIDFSGASLRDSFIRHTGSDLQKYISLKRAQLASLGYDDRAFEGKFVMSAPGIDDLFDMLLGKQTEAPVENFEISETRFGITLPHTRPAPGKITLTPSPIDRCRIKLRNQNRDYPIVLDGDIYKTPPIFDGRGRAIFECDLLKITVDFTPEGSNVNIKQDPLSEATIERWKDFYEARWMMHSIDTVMEVNTIKSGKLFSMNFSTAFDRTTIDERRLIQDSQILDLLYKLQKMAGADAKKTYLSKDLADAREAILMLHQLASEEGVVFIYEDAPQKISAISDKTIRVVNKITVSDVAFAYFGEANIEITPDGQKANVRLRSLKLKGADLIAIDHDSFAEFKRIICEEDVNRLTFSDES